MTSSEMHTNSARANGLTVTINTQPVPEDWRCRCGGNPALVHSSEGEKMTTLYETCELCGALECWTFWKVLP